MQLTRNEAVALLSIINPTMEIGEMSPAALLAYATVREVADKPEMVSLHIKCFHDNSYVASIKLLRAISGMGLKEAKDVVDRLNPTHERGVFGPVMTTTAERAQELARKCADFEVEGVGLVVVGE